MNGDRQDDCSLIMKGLLHCLYLICRFAFAEKPDFEQSWIHVPFASACYLAEFAFLFDRRSLDIPNIDNVKLPG